MKEKQVDIMAILEIKMVGEKVIKAMQGKFKGWAFFSNFSSENAGRILILWNPYKVRLVVKDFTPQTINVSVTCLTSFKEFDATVVYGLHSIVNRRPLWDKIIEYNRGSKPGIMFGDFNSFLQRRK